MKKIVVAFTGPSNSGKTTLITKLSNYLKEQNFKICIVKHDPKDKAVFDTVGKDSYKFSQTGADVAVVSPNKTTLFKQETSSLNEIISLFNQFDYLFIEGLKTIPLPRIAIFRNNIDDEYFKYCSAVASDDTINSEIISKHCDSLDLNNLDEIISWIEKNGKKV